MCFKWTVNTDSKLNQGTLWFPVLRSQWSCPLWQKVSRLRKCTKTVPKVPSANKWHHSWPFDDCLSTIGCTLIMLAISSILVLDLDECHLHWPILMAWLYHAVHLVLLLTDSSRFSDICLLAILLTWLQLYWLSPVHWPEPNNED